MPSLKKIYTVCISQSSIFKHQLGWINYVT